MSSVIQLRPGLTIDNRYVLRGQLGRGGMASVHEAYDPKLDMTVVLKVLPPQLALDPRFVVRFRREGRTLARLTHPNIVRLYEIGEDEQYGLYYLVLECLRGGTLKSRHVAGRWSVDEVVDVLRPVALALDFAHGHHPPFIHRDLKPANILFGEHDRVVVSDFGLARMLEPDDAEELSNIETWGSLTSGAVLGTPAYMAPEQAEGRVPSDAADRYALGVIAYELLLDTLPFVADTPQAVLIQVLTKALPLPSEVDPDIQPAVERVLLKALARDPSLRFSSAIELVEALAEAQSPMLLTPTVEWRIDPEHQPNEATASPSNAPPRPGRLGALAALIGVLAVIATVIVTQLSGNRDASLAVPTAASLAAVELPTTQPTAVPATAQAAVTLVPASVQAAVAVAPTESAPAPTPTLSPEQQWSDLQPQLDQTWDSDLPGTIALLQSFIARHPGFGPARDKLYAALIISGERLAHSDDPNQGVAQLLTAVSLAPSRTEAMDALLALTPTPTPTPEPAAPTPVRQTSTANSSRTSAGSTGAAAPPPTPTKPPFVPPQEPTKGQFTPPSRP